MHQKFILNYLVFQIKQLKKELKIRDESPSPSLSNTSNSPMTAQRNRLGRPQREENTKDFEN